MSHTPGDPDRLVADERVAEAVEARRRQHATRRRGEDDARLSGVLAGLVEHGGHVTVRTRAGGHWQGPVLAVGRDHCVVAAVDGEAVLRLSGIVSVTPPVDAVSGSAQDTRRFDDGEGFVARLRPAADERAEVVLRLDGPDEVVRGHLLAVGEDLVTVRLEGDRGVRYLALAAVTDALLPRRA